MNRNDPRILLKNLARRLYRRGWMDGTSGNLSILAGGTLFITASGRPKGSLSPDEILAVDFQDSASHLPDSGFRPSAEISIHRSIYQIFPDTRAILHVHTVEAALVSGGAGHELLLPPLEILKGLGIADPEHVPPLPVFANDRHVPEIARKIKERLGKGSTPLPGLLIRNHGTTAWGKDLDSALRHLELLEFCFRYMNSTRESPRRR